jgi:RNA polymerase sigma factor (TIGR02999 family)
MTIINWRVVLVMAFPPLDDQEAVRTVECGNAGLRGEHPQKRTRNGRIQDRVGAWRVCDTAPIGKVLATPSPGAVTELLRAWGDGDDAALERLTPLVEGELRRLARGYMGRERRGHTLQVTALVNEAFLRLTDARCVRWQDRAHVLGISARLMRRVLVDHARSRGYRKRGGGAQRVTLHEGLVASPEPALDVVALDRALEALAAVDVRKSRMIELRFFGGLSVEETAEVLDVSPDTVKRDWRLAKLWLLRELEGEGR